MLNQNYGGEQGWAPSSPVQENRTNRPFNLENPELFNRNRPGIIRLNRKKPPGFTGSPVPNPNPGGEYWLKI